MAPVGVQAIYREKNDYTDGMADIFNTLAARALSLLNQKKEKLSSKYHQELTAKVVEYTRKADDTYKGLNEFTVLIKGFYEINQGE